MSHNGMKEACGGALIQIMNEKSANVAKEAY